MYLLLNNVKHHLFSVAPKYISQTYCKGPFGPVVVLGPHIESFDLFSGFNDLHPFGEA